MLPVTKPTVVNRRTSEIVNKGPQYRANPVTYSDSSHSPLNIGWPLPFQPPATPSARRGGDPPGCLGAWQITPAPTSSSRRSAPPSFPLVVYISTHRPPGERNHLSLLGGPRLPERRRAPTRRWRRVRAGRQAPTSYSPPPHHTPPQSGRDSLALRRGAGGCDDMRFCPLVLEEAEVLVDSSGRRRRQQGSVDVVVAEG